MTNPIIHPITTRAPEFPCWLWSLIHLGWLHSAEEDGPIIRTAIKAGHFTHWSPDAPEAPKDGPADGAQGPSDKEMLDWLESFLEDGGHLSIGALSHDFVVQEFGHQTIGRAELLRPAITSAMKGRAG